MLENEVLFDGDFLFEYEYLTSDIICELQEFIKTYVPVPKKVQLKVDEQIKKFKRLGYEDSDISTTRWIVFTRISEKSVSFCDCVEVWLPYGLKVEIKDIGANGKEITHVLKLRSENRKKAINEWGMRISLALETELKDLQWLNELAEKWC